uniref:Uncharacterized protein n=2 Tax=Aegilops tauschii subsp. strangulata TaxID=200361 RepID=A0A453BFM2_AEGTS
VGTRQACWVLYMMEINMKFGRAHVALLGRRPPRRSESSQRKKPAPTRVARRSNKSLHRSRNRERERERESTARLPLSSFAGERPKLRMEILQQGTMSMFPGMDLTKMDPPTLTLLGAACCVMLSMHFTVQLVSQHLFYWKNPKEQKAILIIVLMPPLYAITSFAGLLDIKGSKTFFTCLESVKECYEALVIAKFLALMYSYLNISISKNIVPDEIKGRVLHHSFPVSLFLVSFLHPSIHLQNI